MQFRTENAAHGTKWPSRILRPAMAAILVFGALYTIAGAQVNLLSSASPKPSTTATPTPTPIPISAIVSQAESAKARLREIEDLASTFPSNFDIESQLPTVRERAEAGRAEVVEILQRHPDLDELNRLEREWTQAASDIEKWKASLSSQADEIGRQIVALDELNSLWKRTRAQLTTTQPANTNAGTPENSAGVPDDILRLLNETVFAIETARKQLEQKRTDILAVQSRVSDVEGINDAILQSIKERRTHELSRLFVRDEPPIWEVGHGGLSPETILHNVSISLANHVEHLSRYSAANPGSFIGHGLIIVLFALGFGWAGRKIAPTVEAEPKLERAANLFRQPVAAAFIISGFAFAGIYPHPPRILTAVIGAVMMIPVIFLLRKIIERHLIVVVYWLVGFYFYDRLREVVSGLEIVHRVMFLAEMLAAAGFFFWFSRSKRVRSRVDAASYKGFELVRKLALAASIIFVLAFGANVLGFINLAQILGTGPLGASYAALALYTAYEILQGLIVFVLRVRPLSSLRMVKGNRTLVRRQITSVVKWLAIFVWIIALLRAFSISDAVISFVRTLLDAQASIGSISISVGDVILFVFVVWAAYLVSRCLRFVLQEDVYPRIGVSGGVSYAISTIVNYAILILGFLLAFAALGIQLSQFAFIAGAVGIGVGFGLQNIFNNFVSGLILLAERPVKVGDSVQIGVHQGSLSHIGLRASVLRKVDGSDVIVPNSRLISEEVINWTMSDDKRRLDIPIGVAYGTDPKQVLDLLANVANGNPDVLSDPAPKAIFVGLGESSLNFEMRAWTENTDSWVEIRSDLVMSLHAALIAAGIELPFPQRDLNLRSVDEAILKKLDRNG